MSGYELKRFSLPADQEELLVAELWSLGATGFETHDAEPGRTLLSAYFPAASAFAVGADRIEAWQRLGILLVAAESLADRDWLACYRRSVEPFDVGRRLRIDSGEPSDRLAVGAGSRITLKIPAQTAFGTGSHESTRLVLEWLEDLDLTGKAVLDVGTGSGILAFAAERLGAGRIVACDLDAPSICIARGNARLNVPVVSFRGNAAPRLFAGGVAALRSERRFDLALVNILPENFAGDIPGLARVLKPGGQVISSGNLAERRDQLLARWQRAGLRLEGERRAGEWVAFLLAGKRTP